MSRKLENPVHFEWTEHFPKVSQNFTKSGALWTKFWVHSKCATQEHFRHTSLAHFQFYWLGTLWSHHWVHHKGNCERATQGNCNYILWENSQCSHDVPNGDTLITWSGTLWMYWAFPELGTLQGNWLGKLWMNLQCTGLVFTQYFVHFLAMSLQCTSLGHHPLPPVWAPDPSASCYWRR